MAKDTHDSKTFDPFLVKKRGRPSSGSALTAAQRMAAKRERDRLVIESAQSQSDYAVLSTMGLLQALADAVKNQTPVYARKICAELIKRSTP